jgi:two-component system cell cycle response regulator CtrA
MRILHVDACGLTTGQTRLHLGRDGNTHEAVDLLEDALDMARIYEYDAIITETELPDGSGLRLIRRLREARNHTPILVLSGHSQMATRIEYLRTGADDFLPKPWHQAELQIRIEALVRRSRGHSSPLVRLSPDVSVDTTERALLVSGQRLHLTGKEYGVLELLVARMGQTVSKEALLMSLYGGRDEPEIKIIDVFVCKLRKKMERAGAGKLIQTVWGQGYSIRKPAE